MSRMQGVLFLIALTSLASSPLWNRWGDAPAEFLCFWRLITAGLLLLAFQLLRGKKRLFVRPDPIRWKWTLIAGFFFFLHLWTYVRASQTTSIAHLVILFATNPIFTVAGAGLFFRERLQKRLLFAYPLAFTGIWLLSQERLSPSPESTYGDHLAILSAILHAAYLLSSKQARKTFDNLNFSVGLYLSAGVLFGVLGALRQISFAAPHAHAWMAVLGLILFPTFLGHAIMTYLVSRMNVGVLSCGKLLEPGLSALMAYMIYQEKLSPQSLGAFAMAAGSVILLFWPKQWLPGKWAHGS